MSQPQSNAVFVRPLSSPSSSDPVALATRSQNHAANPEHSAWVNASAGSGKTKVLIDRVLRLLVAGVPPQRILCLTYTKAAATNMVQRLARDLGQWATLDDEKLAITLEHLTQSPPTPESCIRARRLFAATLDAPGGLQFQTIHSFCQSLLARFPLEANVPVGFAILEGRAADNLLQRARRTTLAKASADEKSALGQAVHLLLEKYSGDGFAALEREIVSNRRRLEPLLTTDNSLLAERTLQSQLKQQLALLGLNEGETEDTVLAHFCTMPERDEAALRAIATRMIEMPDGKADSNHGPRLASWLAKDADGRKMLLDDYLSIFLTTKNTPRKDICNAATQKALPREYTVLCQEAEAALRLWEKQNALACRATSAALVHYAAALLQEYHHLKRQQSALDFDDLIAAASHLVTSERAAWVLYKLDGGIDHVLVDEAQDTNEAQWKLIEALTSDFYSGEGQRTPLPARSLFVVGDYKQSIYSFQGANPDAFSAAHERLQDRIAQAGGHLETVRFSVSFRSTSAVLGAVDRVFMQHPPLQGLAHYADHISFSPELPGMVELWPVAPTGLDAQGAPLAPHIGLARVIARRIRRMVSSGYQIPSRGRAATYGDFLILVRSRGNFMPELVRACKQNGVPVSGADRMVIDEQLAVEDLLAFANFLLLPEDDLTLACVLKGPLIGLDEESLFTLAHNREQASLLTRLGRDEYGHAYAAWLSGWLRRADRITPYALLSSLLAEPCPASSRSGRHALIHRLGPEAADPIDELLNLALAYEETEPPTLQGFLRWIQSGKTEIKREMDQAGGLVRVMTVHGSKGLEAPIVIVADSLSEKQTSSKILLDAYDQAPPLLAPSAPLECAEMKTRRAHLKQRESHEKNRLLYVALTRAEDHLIFAAWAQKNSKFDADGRLEGSTKSPKWWHLLENGLKGASEVMFDLREDGGWQGMGYRLELGSSHQRNERRSHQPPHLQDMPTELPAWIAAPPPEEPTPSRPLTPSKPEEDEPASLSPFAAHDETQRFARGQLIHRLLQTLPDLPPDQRKSAGLHWLGKQISAPEAIVAEVMKVIDDPQTAVIFGPQSRAEIPVNGKVGRSQRVLSGQIDRLAVTDNEVWIADFKTNRTPPSSVAEVPGAYLRQMALYAAALAPLYPGKKIRTVLVWTNIPAVMEIFPESLAPYVP